MNMDITKITPQSLELQSRINKLFGENSSIPEIKYTGCSMIKTAILLRLLDIAEKSEQDDITEYDAYLKGY